MDAPRHKVFLVDQAGAALNGVTFDADEVGLLCEYVGLVSTREVDGLGRLLTWHRVHCPETDGRYRYFVPTALKPAMAAWAIGRDAALVNAFQIDGPTLEPIRRGGDS